MNTLPIHTCLTKAQRVKLAELVGCIVGFRFKKESKWYQGVLTELHLVCDSMRNEPCTVVICGKDGIRVSFDPKDIRITNWRKPT